MKHQCRSFKFKSINQDHVMMICTDCGRAWSVEIDSSSTREQIISELLVKQRRFDK